MWVVLLTDAKSVVKDRHSSPRARFGVADGVKEGGRVLYVALRRGGEKSTPELCMSSCEESEQRGGGTRGSPPGVACRMRLRAARYFERPRERECDRFRASGETGDLLQARQGRCRHPLVETCELGFRVALHRDRSLHACQRGLELGARSTSPFEWDSSLSRVIAGAAGASYQSRLTDDLS